MQFLRITSLGEPSLDGLTQQFSRGYSESIGQHYNHLIGPGGLTLKKAQSHDYWQEVQVPHTWTSL